jgi:uracil-DNA glycosylase family 4
LGANTALVCIGQNPGFKEDLEDAPFLGRAGTNLWKSYLTPILRRHPLDVYLTNAIRCGPDPVTEDRYIKACFPRFAVPDLAKVVMAHPQTIIWCIGSVAANAVGLNFLGKKFSLEEARSSQPFSITVSGKKVPVFATYHSVLRNRTVIPRLVSDIELLDGYLAGRPVLQELPDHIDLVRTIGYPKELSLDIETYGAVKGFPKQTQHHPIRSQAIDGIRMADLIQTVACHGDGKTTVLNWDSVAERFYLRLLISKAERLLGANLLFDLSYLCHCDPVLGKEITRKLADHELTIQDVLHLGAVDDPDRPERSLAKLSKALGVGALDKPLASGTRFPSSRDKELRQYNAKDTIATVKVRDKLAPRLEQHAWTPFAQSFYTGLTRYALHMTESGVYYSQPALHELFKRCQERRDRCRKIAYSQYGLRLSGEGSELDIRAFMRQLADGDAKSARTHPAFRPTKKKRDVAINFQTRRLISFHLPVDHPAQHALKIIDYHERANKLVTSHIAPLLDKWLTGKHTEPLLPVYPSWFVFPTAFKDEMGGSGGTAQSRFAAHSPPEQTRPKQLEACRCSRYGGLGTLISVDLSQAELRTAALLSKDRYLTRTYTSPHPTDLHTELSVAVEGAGIVNHPYFHTGNNEKDPRQAYKTIRFLTLYGGGANEAQVSLLKKLGTVVPMNLVATAISTLRHQQSDWYTWAARLAEQTRLTGKVILALTGQRRFIDVEENPKTAANYPVQAHAANTMHSIAIALLSRLPNSARIILNVHDSITIDCLKSQSYEVMDAIENAVVSVSTVGYWDKLRQAAGSTHIPLEYSIKEHHAPRLRYPDRHAREAAIADASLFAGVGSP